MRKVYILDVGVHAQPFEAAANRIIEWSQADTPRYVCTCPVYTLMIAQEMPAVRAALDAADMVSADGMPVVWMQRYHGALEAERCFGPGLMRAVAELSAGTGLRHYLWGGQSGVPEQLQASLRREYGDVNVVGWFSPPFEEVGTPPRQEYIERINAAKPDIVWVGLGSPKQDIWMHMYREHLNAPVLIGVGAAFDFLSGRKRQAPKWLGDVGLEWSFRLLQEPRRLARRYLKYNTLFVWRVLREELI
jgi:N-acetylglucosaminyldiphosphoundecaprenol N-acetyl-beta-D-mannosaminyltransferase